MIKFLLKTICAIIILIVLCLVGVYFYIGDIAKKAVETYVPQITKTSAHLGGLNVSLFNGEISLNDLKIGNPNGYKSKDAFSVKNVTVRFQPKTILEDKIIIDQILVDGTFVSAEATYKDGTISSNLTTIKENVDAFTKSDTTPNKKSRAVTKTEKKPDASSKQVVIKDLQINNSSLTLGFLNQTMDIPLPNIQQQNIGEKGQKKSLKDTVVYLFDLISIESMKAVATGVQDFLKNSANEVLEGASNVVDEAKKSGKELLESVKGIF